MSPARISGSGRSVQKECVETRSANLMRAKRRSGKPFTERIHFASIVSLVMKFGARL